MSAPTPPVPASSWRRRAWLGYLFGLHALCAVLVWKTNFLPLLRFHLGWAPAHENPYVSEMVLFQGRMDHNVPDGTTVFLGDSLTQGLASVAVEPRSVNYGIGGQTTRQMIEALPSYGSLPRARAIVLMIGINDVMHGQAEGLEARYQRILAGLPEQVPLYWHGLMPAGRRQSVPLPELQAINARIQALCARRAQCTYVDPWPWMVDAQGHMRAPLYLGDFLHLSPQGYDAWIGGLKAVLARRPA